VSPVIRVGRGIVEAKDDISLDPLRVVDEKVCGAGTVRDESLGIVSWV